MNGSVTSNGVIIWFAFAAVVVYVAGDLVSGLLYHGYSFRDQAISELSAFGSPVRPLMVASILTHGALLAGYGFVVVRSANRTSLRWLGAFLIALGLVGFPTHTVWAMTSRGSAPGFNDTMHLAMTVAFSILATAAIVLSAVTFRGWFRAFAVGILLLIILFGMAASFEMRGLQTNDTPWAGVFERVNAYAYLVWLISLAMILVRARAAGKAGQ